MSEFLLAETPSDVIDLILDLAIKFKIDEFDFNKYIELLKKWHNKKIVRELLLEIISNKEKARGIIFSNIDYIDEENSGFSEFKKRRDKKWNDFSYFIVDLLELDEIGLAKKFYDILIYLFEDFQENDIIQIDNKPQDFIIEYCIYNDYYEYLFKLINSYQLYKFLKVRTFLISKLQKESIKYDTDKILSSCIEYIEYKDFQKNSF